jgi:hypothetical protein
MAQQVLQFTNEDYDPLVLEGTPPTQRPDSSLWGVSPSVELFKLEGPVDDLVKAFNTALVSTKANNAQKPLSEDLFTLMQTPAYSILLRAVRQHAQQSHLSDREAAEQLIQTFRKLDQLWSDYLIQEGLERLRSGNSSHPGGPVSS